MFNNDPWITIDEKKYKIRLKLLLHARSIKLFALMVEKGTKEIKHAFSLNAQLITYIQ